MIQRDGIFALEAQIYTLSEHSVGTLAAVAFLDELLQHERRSAAREPAPANAAFRLPLVLHRETEAVEVEAQGALHNSDAEKWNDLSKIGGSHRCCRHGLTPNVR